MNYADVSKNFVFGEAQTGGGTGAKTGESLLTEVIPCTAFGNARLAFWRVESHPMTCYISIVLDEHFVDGHLSVVNPDYRFLLPDTAPIEDALQWLYAISDFQGFYNILSTYSISKTLIQLLQP